VFLTQRMRFLRGLPVDGTIDVMSEIGKGSSFNIRLQASPVAASVEPPAA